MFRKPLRPLVLGANMITSFLFSWLITQDHNSSYYQKSGSLFLTSLPHHYVTLPKAGREKIGSPISPWHYYFGSGVLVAFWSTGLVLSVGRCLVPWWCPRGSRSLYLQLLWGFPGQESSLSYIEPLFARSVALKLLGPEAFPVFTTSCARVT